MLEGKVIFYIEDDANNRDVVQMIVGSAGAKIEFDKWGFPELIVSKIKLAHPDIILLDLMFPANISGYDVFDIIRQYPYFNHIPIVAVSASDPAIEIPKARARGFAGFINKPLNIQTFNHKLLSVLEGQEVWD